MEAKACPRLTVRSSRAPRPEPPEPDESDTHEDQRPVAGPDVGRPTGAPGDRRPEDGAGAEVGLPLPPAAGADGRGVAGRRRLHDVPAGLEGPQARRAEL